MPTGGRHEGKVLFHFGNVPVYIDPVKKLVCAKRAGASGGYQPTSLAKLVEAATASVTNT